MKIYVAGEDYILTEKSIAAIIEGIQGFLIDQYDKLPDTAKLAAMAGVRAILAYAEKTEKNPEKKKLIRPPRGTDPTIHLVGLLLGQLGEILPNVECEITTDERYISNFAFKYASSGGGQISSDGNIGIRQDDGCQVTG